MENGPFLLGKFNYNSWCYCERIMDFQHIILACFAESVRKFVHVFSIKGKKAASYHRRCSVIPNQMDQNVRFQRWTEMDGPCHDGPNSVLDGTLSKITHHLQLLQVMPHQPELPCWSFSSPFLSQICHRTVLFALKNPPKSIPSWKLDDFPATSDSSHAFCQKKSSKVNTWCPIKWLTDQAACFAHRVSAPGHGWPSRDQ